MNRIVWLASYPKSGNTWLRVLFSNLKREDGCPARINDLDTGYHAAVRAGFDESVGYSSADLTHDEVDLLRPHVYRHESAHADGPLLRKVHDAYAILPDGQPLFPPESSAGAIYLIRNPLDVCVSYAHHMGQSNHDVTITLMADPNYAYAASGRSLSSQIRQRLRTWSEHVLSWTDAPGMAVHVVRYEDMHASPVEMFAAAAAFAGLPADRERVARAVSFSAFEGLQRQEETEGFEECTGPSRRFFRKGKVGSWREALTDAQAARIINDHRKVMERFGYLNDAGESVY